MFDILADELLDYEDDVLENFDLWSRASWPVELDRKAQTLRLLRAISHPHTTIIGHMTGRQPQRRPGYEVAMKKVLRAANRNVVVEINAHRWRLDLDGAGTRRPLSRCMLSINPDAHSIPELDHMHWGVAMARKGGVPRRVAVSWAMPALPEITRYLRQKRRSLARAAARCRSRTALIRGHVVAVAADTRIRPPSPLGIGLCCWKAMASTATHTRCPSTVIWPPPAPRTQSPTGPPDPVRVLLIPLGKWASRSQRVTWARISRAAKETTDPDRSRRRHLVNNGE